MEVSEVFCKFRSVLFFL